MASFYAYDFEYDNVPSQRFDLKIITFEDGGLFSGVGSSNVNILTQRVLRKSKPYYLGRTQEPVLEFPLTFGTSKAISALDRDLISSWLFGRSGYKKLYILQDDLNGAYFNCMFKDPEPQYIGNINYAFACTVSCDSPFAYGPQRTVSGSALGGVYTSFDIYNSSSEDEYLYPILHFIIGDDEFFESSYRSFSIVNYSDSEREFAFTNFPGTGIIEITMDNDTQIITSDTTGLLTYFNNNWFRLVPKHNLITVYSTEPATLFEVKYTERFKMGG